MNFKNQISTSREQSERLLSLGVKPETADMSIPTRENPNLNVSARPYHDWNTYWKNHQYVIPSWSLSRLLEMMPPYLENYGSLYLNCGLHIERYNAYNKDKAHKYNVEFGIGSTTSRYENVFDCIIETIGWLILNGHFNKEYLNDNP